VTQERLSEEALAAALTEAEGLVEVGATYCHYKDASKPYKVTGLAFLEAQQQPCVIYQALYGSDFMRKSVWVRPIDVWTSEVLFEGKKVPRFRKKEP
jgi:hypothetical protein